MYFFHCISTFIFSTYTGLSTSFAISVIHLLFYILIAADKSYIFSISVVDFSLTEPLYFFNAHPHLFTIPMIVFSLLTDHVINIAYHPLFPTQVMPGLLLCFVLRFDNHKKRTSETGETSKITYFHCSLIGYFIGMLTFLFYYHYITSLL